MQQLEGKVAFVTGGASGLGLAMTRAFRAADMKVVVADVEDAALARVRDEFAGDDACVVTKLDVTDREGFARAADLAESTFGNVHVLCNNAGVVVSGSIERMQYADWDWVQSVNLGGVINGLQTFIARIKRHGEGGHIVNTASIAGQIPLQGLTIYNATKYAVVGISETIRLELAPHNIGVSVLCPGAVATNIGSAGRNRPAALQAEAQGQAELAAMPGGAQAAAGAIAMSELLNRPINPSLVGDMVVAAIRNDDAYIFTHPELQALTNARRDGLDAGFAKWARYTTTQNQ